MLFCLNSKHKHSSYAEFQQTGAELPVHIYGEADNLFGQQIIVV